MAMQTRVLKGRGAKGIVSVNGSVLFAPGTDIDRWRRRFSARLTTAVKRHAPYGTGPTVKYPNRTMRPHPGPHLRDTITSSTGKRITKDGGFFYLSTGSTVPYALYVDQGTGIYGGNGPYEATLLPPFEYGEGSLFEKSPWMPKVMIKGQKGQEFFEKGLEDAFRSMLRRSYQVPGEGVSQMKSALRGFPENLFGSGATNEGTSPGFEARRRMWREWKREAYDRQRSKNTYASRTKTYLDSTDRKERRRQYDAIGAAYDRRAREQAERLRIERERRAVGERKRAEADKARREQDAKNRAQRELAAGNRHSQDTARAYYNMIRTQYPDAVIGKSTLADGVVLWQVRYTDHSGVVHRERWAYGYDV